MNYENMTARDVRKEREAAKRAERWTEEDVRNMSTKELALHVSGLAGYYRKRFPCDTYKAFNVWMLDEAARRLLHAHRESRAVAEERAVK